MSPPSMRKYFTTNSDTEKKNRSWQFWLCSILLPAGLFIQLTGFFWLENPHRYRIVVTYSLLLLALLATFSRQAWQSAIRSPLFLIILVYLTYMSTIPFLKKISDPTDCFKWSFYTFLYVFAIAFRMQTNPKTLKKLLFACAVLCATAVIYGLILDLSNNVMLSETYRFTGYAALYNPVRSGQLFGFFYVISLWLAISSRPMGTGFFALCIALVCLAGTLLTGSRSPLFGLLIAGIYLIIYSLPERMRTIALVANVSLMIALCLIFSNELTERGLSFRPQIWSEVLRLWQLNPWLGAGYNLTPFIRVAGLEAFFSNPHNILLTVLYYGGIVGALLFVTIYLITFIQAARKQKLSPWALLVTSLILYGLVTLQFDGGDIISRPHEFWLLLWFPIALLLHIKKNELSFIKTNS